MFVLSDHDANDTSVQLLPYADNILVLGEDGRITERGSFDHLNSTDGLVAALGLKKAAMEAAVETDALDVETELREKEAALECIASAKALDRKATGLLPNTGTPGVKVVARGKRNADAMFSYLRSLGGKASVLYVFFTLCTVGFRTAQRTFLLAFSCVKFKPKTDREQRSGSMFGRLPTNGILVAVLGIMSEFTSSLAVSMSYFWRWSSGRLW